MIDLLRIILTLADKLAALTATAIDDKLVAIARAVAENQALIDLLLDLLRPASAPILDGTRMPIVDGAPAEALASAGLTIVELITLARWLITLAAKLNIDLPALVRSWAGIAITAPADQIPDGV